jgi:multidrug efflux system membrane fusion protein
MKRLVMAVAFLAIGAGGYGAWWWWQQSGAVAAEGKGGKGKGAPLFVKTAKAVAKPMPVLIEAVGSVEPEHSVQVRAQVSGVLQSVLFKEGDLVKAGQQLFQIDPRTFEALYRQSQAQLARDEAQLENAQVQRDRLEPLLKREFITRQEFDVAVTSTKSLEATVAADRALLEQARIQLDFTRIQAPIGGRTGSLAIKPGNLVPTAGGGVPLVTINSTDPILVSFSIPERQLEDIRRYQYEKEMRIEILPDRSGPVAAEGKLVFIDNTVTPQTGTVVLKTRVTNKEEVLWPGQFINVRIVLKIEPEAVVVPEVAVQPGQQGTFVYMIDDGKAKIQPVKVSRQIDGEVVIAEGIKAGDIVLTEIPQAIAPGAAVQIAGADGKGDSRGKRMGKDKGKRSEDGEERKGDRRGDPTSDAK